MSENLKKNQKSVPIMCINYLISLEPTELLATA